MPSKSTSSIIKEFGIPPGLDMEKAKPQPDEESTDHGSSHHSDNEAASSTSESFSPEVQHPATTSFLAAPMVNRRLALQQTGAKVLGNMNVVPTSGANGRKKAKALTGKVPQAPATSIVKPPALCPQPVAVRVPAPVQAALVPGHQAPVEEAKSGAQKKRASLRNTKPLITKHRTNSLDELWTAWDGNAQEERDLTDVPPMQTSDEMKPIKVLNCASFGLDLKMPLTLDPSLPAKKRPIFDCETAVRVFDPQCPLKKRVPDYFLEEPLKLFVVGF